jgi:hypothetical protein
MLPLLTTFARMSARDAFWRSEGHLSPDQHLEAATNWLIRAQDVNPDDGVSYGYSLRGGWRPSYIETTGYIAATFFKLARQRNSPELKARAVRMANWLCHVQNADGSFPNPRFNNGEGIVFDTGQDIFGLLWAFKQTGEQRFLDAAERAGNWLVGVADAEGRWTHNEYLNTPHSYNTRTAWALLQLHGHSPKPERERIARANLDWAISQQQSSGLFNNCAFRPGLAPYTHTIAYTIRGLWEASILLEDNKYKLAALHAAEAMTSYVADSGFIPGQISPNGNPKATYCCLTGNCQLSISWAKMARLSGNEQYRRAAVSALRYVMERQDITTKDLNVNGAIAGSYPIWGRYSPFTYPNWAAKFFIDAIDECREWV